MAWIDNVTIRHANIKDLECGISAQECNYSLISGSNITGGIPLESLGPGGNNTIYENNIAGNVGIYGPSANNTVSGNNIAGDIYVYMSMNNAMFGNNTTDSSIFLHTISNNTVPGNKITGGPAPRSIRIGDSDRDGILDLKVSFNIADLKPLLHIGINTFTASGTGKNDHLSAPTQSRSYLSNIPKLLFSCSEVLQRMPARSIIELPARP